MNLSNDILSRVKKTWELLYPAPASYCPPRRIDHLVKMNLPPLMGRRDAAYDQAAELISEDVFALTEQQRRTVYRQLNALLDGAEEDTRSILATLSSPDTESREKNMCSFLTLLRKLSLVLCDFSQLNEELFQEENTVFKNFAIQLTDAEVARSERMISEAEINIVNQLRAYFGRSLPKITRYREYTGKSFSHSYASRYAKSYEVYSKLYRTR